ncbi:MAG: permease-like cell division protein FtsX [Candidatus Nealsonbacteria bacterium]
MFFTSLKRIIKSGWHGFFRDGGMITANVFVLLMAISVFTSLFLFKNVSNFIVDSIEDKVDISVYFEYEVLEDEILEIKEEVSGIPEVKEVSYVSKDDALENFIERHSDDETLMQSLEEVGVNPFLASLNIKAFEFGQYEGISSFLEGSIFQTKIDKIDYYEREPVIKRVFSLTTTFSRIGIILSIIMALVAILVVFNTTRLAIYNFREEIRIQRLVGASNWFIRGPFLVQGMVAGIFAGSIGLALFGSLTWLFNSTINGIFPGLGVFSMFVSNIWLIILLQLGIGAFLGTISSLLAVRSHLNV